MEYLKEDSKAQIQAWKDNLDIVTVAEKYGELIKVGSSFRYKDDKSLTINPSKQIFNNFSDNGKNSKGSVLDLIIYMEKCNLSSAIQILKNLNGVDDYVVDPAKQIKRKEEVLTPKFSLHQLNLFANKALSAVSSYMPYVVDLGDGACYLQIKEPFVKLFETQKLDIVLEKKIKYIFTHMLGYDKYFQCPYIILRDSTGKVVDSASYRPVKPDNYKNWDDSTKYILKSSKFRGDNFLYPFQKEIEQIIKREKYIIVGEGIKNGINALLYSAPFISVESTSNRISQTLIDYIKAYKEKGYGLICFFDGDKAGEDGYKHFIEQTGLEVENYLDFNSNIDFTDYLMEGEK